MIKIKVELDEEMLVALHSQMKLIPGYPFSYALKDLVRRAIEEYGLDDSLISEIDALDGQRDLTPS